LVCGQFIGDQRELFLLDEQPDEEVPYERLISDVMAGNGSLFIEEDSAQAAWTVADPVLRKHRRAYPCRPGSWGPKEADPLIASDGRRHNPGPAAAAIKEAAPAAGSA
jgi:glucose-6-phosphate 1-dehydrogenase